MLHSQQQVIYTGGILSIACVTYEISHKLVIAMLLQHPANMHTN